MSAAKALIALAAGERPSHDRLLHACRCEWLGNEFFGEEAIVEMFAAAPLDMAEATAVETPMGLALFAGQSALIADLYDERIGRLWRLSPGTAALAEPSVAVAFDPDLVQARLDVHLAPGDHPELSQSMRERAEAAGRTLIRNPSAAGGIVAHRLRAFALRAFGSGERAAVLFALYQLGGGDVRSAVFRRAAILLDGEGDPLVIEDSPPIPTWRPRL